MEEQQKILQLHCLKHIKIFKLKQTGLKNKEIANLLGTNSGHVYNALKKYNGNEELIAKAEAIQ
jgi:transcriptional regulator